uniref:Uncharacterized protein n=1 Tax=Anguilla anguilla TaxID=7936 RepID=A0A0E9S4G4_ANGAN
MKRHIRHHQHKEKTHLKKNKMGGNV